MIHTLRDKSTLAAGEDLLTNLQRRYVQIMAAVSALAGLAGIVAQLVNRSGARGTGFTIGFVILNLAILYLANSNRVRLASAILLIALIGTTLALSTQFLIMGMLTAVSVAVLANSPVYILGMLIVTARFIMNMANINISSADSGELSPAFLDMIAIGIALVIVSATTRYFITSIQRSAAATHRNASLLSATSEVGHIATTILDLQELFSRSVNLIQERFGFYHVQVFMVRDTMAELVASTGDAGQQLLAREHKIEVGSNSVIGRVTHAGEPVVARDTDSDAVHRHNPLLPHTRAELAVPILDGNTVIGALDMQSTEPDAFQDEDVQALQTMANLLSTAIRNARLFEAQEKAAQEQQRVVQQSEANLREIQRLNRQLTRLGWDDYVNQSPDIAGVTLEADQFLPTAEWSESLIEATRHSKTVVHQANGRPGVVAVPVTLRGEVIGAIEVEADDEVAQTEAIEMAQAVAQRLATSLDNARLFEEAQASTIQEQRINTIVARYQSATSVDDLLRITLTELSEALGAQRGAIRLGTLPKEYTNGGAAQ